MRRALAVLAAVLLATAPAAAQTRIGDLVSRPGDVPRRLVGYGLVTGLDGTGDRSFGGFMGETMTIRSILNLLRRFNIFVPPEVMQARNAAAVLVTAELSPYLRPGGRFEVQVSSLGDATSLKGGVLWITPLMTDPNQPPVATAQGPLLIADDGSVRGGTVAARRGNSGRIPDGGVLEVELGGIVAASPKLQLRRPDLQTAARIAAAINAAVGPTTARVDDPGQVTLTPQGAAADNLLTLLAQVDTLPVSGSGPSRVVISARDGAVVAGGDVRVGLAAVSHRGITLRIGGTASPASAPGDSTAATGPAAAPGARPSGLLALQDGATVQDVAAGLHAAGATSQEMASIFESLVEVGALRAQVVVR